MALDSPYVKTEGPVVGIVTVKVDLLPSLDSTAIFPLQFFNILYAMKRPGAVRSGIKTI